MKVRRENVCYALVHYQKKFGMEDYSNIINFNGTIISGNGKNGCSASFDDMPADYNEAHVKRRSMLSIVDPEEEEQEHDHVAKQCDENENKESNIKFKSQREISNLSNDDVCSTNRFVMKCQDVRIHD